MNNLMTRKKKYRYSVELCVEELQHVPFLNQELYVKVRLLDGGFTTLSKSVMVKNHTVQWDETFPFTCKMTANATTGELDTCICRISVRQEVRGGKSFQKLGYADVNLAQFPGNGDSQLYLLEAYNSKHRLHNSTLRVKVDMTLLSGDPCVKAQTLPRPLHAPTIEASTEVPHNRPTTGSVGSVSSLGYSSLDKKMKGEDQECTQAEQAGHSRNSSNTSGSGYVSNVSDKSGHVRIESLRKIGAWILAKVERQRMGKEFLPCMLPNNTMSGSQGSAGGVSEGGSLERPSLGGANRSKSSSHSDANKDPRVLATREDAHDTINQIFEQHVKPDDIVKQDDAAESSGLQLYIRQDGTASVRGAIRPSEEFKPIIFNER